MKNQRLRCATAGLVLAVLPAITARASDAKPPVTDVVDAAQSEIETFLGSGGLGMPHAAAPPELDQLGRLVGVWQAAVEMRRQDGQWAPAGEAVWVWKYALGGFATQDLWLHPKDHLPPYLTALGRSYQLTGLRVYDPNQKTWNVAWVANSLGRSGGADFGTLSGQAEGDDVVLLGSSPFGEQRITFTAITDRTFTWTSEFRPPNGEWTAGMRVNARRVR